MTGAKGGSRVKGRTRALSRRLVAVLAVVVIAGCATPPSDDPEEVAEFQRTNDPAEPINRVVFDINQGVDKLVFKPVTGVYRGVVPEPMRRGVHNFLHNLRTPVILFNDLLQGNFDRAATTLSRFVVNSTVGILGFNDAAAGLGLEPHREDFGQTLAVWGANEGPYIMLPILGPSNPRDAIGSVVDFLIDPITWWAQNTDRDNLLLARTVANGIDTRDQLWDVLEELEKSSIDYYAAIRSLYRQRRADEIRNGVGSDTGPAPRFSGDFEIAGPSPIK